MKIKGRLKIHFHAIRIGKDPYLDWSIILACALMAAVIALSFGGALWNTIRATSSVEAGFTNPASAAGAAGAAIGQSVKGLELNMTDLDTVIKAFEAKATATSLYSSGYLGPADPSF